MHSRLGTELAERLADALTDVQVESVDEGEFPDCEILVANTLPSGLLRCSPRLRWLQLTSVGTDQLAVAGPPPDDLLVTNAGDVPSRAVAEFVLMGMLALAKDAPGLVRRQHEHRWQPNYAARLLAGETLLLLGLGSVGRAVAVRARAFGMRVVAVTRTGRADDAADLVISRERLLEVAKESLFLVAAVPGTEETTNLVSRQVLRALPDGAFVINVGRPTVLETEALVAELSRLGGAMLDVHDEEPLPSSSGLWRADRLWVTPHTAFGYPGEGADLADLICDNYSRFRAGTPLRNLVRAGSSAVANTTPPMVTAAPTSCQPESDSPKIGTASAAPKTGTR